MLSQPVRILLYILIVLYGVLGVVLYVAPAWAAPNFAWRVSPFVAMNIGAWCLGNAWLALVITWRKRWPTVMASAIYLGLFGVLEAAVLVAFWPRVVFPHPIAWLYVATLAVTCLFALMALADAWRNRPIFVAIGQPVGSTEIAIAVILSAFTGGYLGIGALTLSPSELATVKMLFPEEMSLFTLRAVATFYFVLGLSMIPLLLARGFGNFLTHSYAGFGFLVMITLAGLINIRLFDFTGYPTQYAFFGLYILAGAVLGYYLVRYGTGASGIAREERPSA